MLSNVATTILNRFLSNYVESFNKDEVNLNLWSGEAKLKNVALKTDALDFLNLPVAVRLGFIGKIHIQCDWKRLTSKPVVVQIDDVRIVAVPRSNFRVDEAQELRRALEAKLQSLEAWEALWLEPHDEGTGEGYVGKLIEKIIDNVHVIVRRVHVRFEDIDGHNEDTENYAFGLSIGNISAQTTDEHWEPSFLSEKSSAVVRKLVRLDDLCVYLNKDVRRATLKSMDAYWNPRTLYQSPEASQHILAPMSAFLKLKQHKQPAKIDVEMSIPEVVTHVSEFQYRSVLAMASTVSIAGKYGQYLRHRPAESVAEEPGAWWKHAIKCVVRDNRKKRVDFATLVQRRKDRRKYSLLYERRLNTPWLQPPDEETKRQLRELEERYSLEDVLYFRQCAIQAVKAQFASSEEPVLRREFLQKKGVFSRFFGSGNGPVAAPNEITRVRRDEIFDAYSLSLVTTEEEKPEEEEVRDLLNLNLSLGAVEVALVDPAQTPLVKLSLTGTGLAVQQRTHDNMTLHAELGSLSVLDLVTRATAFPDIVRASRKDSGGPLVSLDVDLKPVDKSADVKVRMAARALQITLVREVIDRVALFFVPLKPVDLSALEEAAFQQLSSLRASTEAHLQDALAQRQKLLLDVNLEAPSFVVPQNPRDARGRALVMQLGALSLSSDLSEDDEAQLATKRENLRTRRDIDDEELSTEQLHTFFDTFHIKVRNVAVLLREPDGQELFLVPLFNIGILAHTSLFGAEPSLPNAVIELVIPQIEVAMSTSKLYRLSQVLATITAETESSKEVRRRVENFWDEYAKMKQERLQLDPLETEQQVTSKDIQVTSEQIAETMLTKEDKLRQAMNKLFNLDAAVHLLKFTLSEDGIEEMRSPAAPVLEARIEGVGAHLAVRSSDLRVALQVGSLRVFDPTESDFGDIVHTTSQQQDTKQGEFFKVKLHQIARDSPIFDGTEVDVALGAGTLVVSVNPGTLAHLSDFALTSLPPALAPLTADSTGGSNADAEQQRRDHKDTVRADEDENQVTSEEPKMKTLRTSLCTLALHADLGGVTVRINAHRHRLALLALAGVDADVRMYESGALDADVGMRALEVTDLSPRGADHRAVVTSRPAVRAEESGGASEQRLIAASVRMHSETGQSDYCGHDMEVSAGMSGLEVRLCMRFLNEVLALLLSHGPLAQLIAQQSGGSSVQVEEVDAEADQSAQLPQETPQETPKTLRQSIPHVHVEMRDISVTLPRASNDDQWLRVALELALDTVEDDASDNAVMQLTNFDLSATSSFSPEVLVPLLALDRLDITLSQSPVPDVEGMCIDLALGTVRSALAQQHYAMLMHVLSNNLAEVATLVPSVYAAVDTVADKVEAAADKAAVDAAAPVEEDKQEQSGMKISLKLEHLDMQLRRNQGREEDSLVVLSVRDTAVTLAMGALAQAETDIDTTVGSLVIYDASTDSRERGVQEHFARLVSLETLDCPPVDVCLRMGRQRMQIGATLTAPNVIFGGVLWSLAPFFVVAPMQTPATVDATLRPVVELEPEESPISEVEEDSEIEKQLLRRADTVEKKDHVTMEIKVTVQRPQVLLISDPTRASPAALVLHVRSVGATVGMTALGSVTVAASVEHVRVARATVHSHDKHVRPSWHTELLAPLSLTADVQMAESRTLRETQCLRADADITPVRALLTFADYALLMRSIEALVPPAVETEEETAAAAEATETAAGETPVAAGFGDMDVHVRVRSVVAQLVNDVGDARRPLLRVSVREVGADVRACDRQQVVWASVGSVRADYFDDKRVAWQPLLEPLEEISASVVQQCGFASEEESTEVSLSTGNVEANFCRGAMLALTEALEVLSVPSAVDNLVDEADDRLEQSAADVEDDGDDMQRVRNKTEFALILAYCDKKTVLLPNEVIDLNVPRRPTHSVLGREEAPCAFVDLCVAPLDSENYVWSVITDVPLDRVGTVEHFAQQLAPGIQNKEAELAKIQRIRDLPFDKEEKDLEAWIASHQESLRQHAPRNIFLMSEVRLSRGGIVETVLCSPVRLENKTGHDVRAYGQSEHVPLLCAQLRSWQFCLNGDTASFRNDRRSRAEYLRFPGVTLVAHMQFDSHAKCSTVTLLPGMRVQNMLAAPLTMQVAGEDTRQRMELDVGEESAVCVSWNECSQEVSLLAVPAYGVSLLESLSLQTLFKEAKKHVTRRQTTLVEADVGSVESEEETGRWEDTSKLPPVLRRFTLQGSQGEELTICMDMRFNDAPWPYCPTVTFFAEFFLFDATDLSLRFADAYAKERVAAAAQSDFLDGMRRRVLAEREEEAAEEKADDDGDDEEAAARRRFRSARMFSFRADGRGHKKQRLVVTTLAALEGSGGSGSGGSGSGGSGSGGSGSGSNGRWSSHFCVGAVGVTGEVTGVCERQAESSRRAFSATHMQLGVSVAVAGGAFSRTKAVTVAPRFVVHNRFEIPVMVRTAGCEAEFELLPDEKRTMHLLSPKGDTSCPLPLLEFRPRGCGEWSAPLPMDAVGQQDVRLCLEPEVFTAASLRVVEESHGSHRVLLSPLATKFAPFQVWNRTLGDTIRFAQDGVNRWVTLKPGESSWHVLDVPVPSAVDGKKISTKTVLHVGDVSTALDIDGMADSGDSERLDMSGYWLHCHVHRQGVARILVLSDLPHWRHFDPTATGLLDERDERQEENLAVLRERQQQAQQKVLSLTEQLRLLYERQEVAEESEHAGLGSAKPLLLTRVVRAKNLKTDDAFLHVSLSTLCSARGVSTTESEKIKVEARGAKTADALYDRQLQFALPTRIFGGTDRVLCRAKVSVLLVHKGLFKHKTLAHGALPCVLMRQDHLEEELTAQASVLSEHLDAGVVRVRADEETLHWVTLSDQGGKVLIGVRGVRSVADFVRQQVSELERRLHEQRLVLNNVQSLAGDVTAQAEESATKQRASQRMSRVVLRLFDAEGAVFEAPEVEVHLVQRHADHRDTVRVLPLKRRGVSLVTHAPWQNSILTNTWLHTETDEDEVTMRVIAWSGSHILREHTHVLDLSQVRRFGDFRFHVEEARLRLRRLESATAARVDERKKKKTKRTANKAGEKYTSLEQVELRQHWVDFGGEDAALLCVVERFEALRRPLQSALTVQATVPHVGLSVVDGRPRDLLYVTLDGLRVGVTQASDLTTLQLSLDRAQVDSQLPDAVFPVVLGAAPVPRAQWQPLVQVSLAKRNTESETSSALLSFQLVSLLVQRMEVNVEERLIWDVVALAQSLFAAAGDDVAGLRARDWQALVCDTRGYDYGSLVDTFLHFTLLHLHPLAIDVSFRAQPHHAMPLQGGAAASLNPIVTVLRALLGTVGAIDRAPLRMNALVVRDAFGQADAIVWPLVSHYVSQGVRQAYKILGSVDVLGNPVALLSSLGSGVADFFYEPAQGAMQSPQDFALGLSRGSKSLLSHAVGGVLTAASRVTASLGKGAALLSMDADFVARREAQHSRRMADRGSGTAERGLTSGVKALGRGVAQGVGGVVLDPLRGAKRDGVGGFFKGMAKGVVGVVAKPVSGVLDLASHALHGVGDTAHRVGVDESDVVPLVRVRFPRVFRADGRMLRYVPLDAVAAHLLAAPQDAGGLGGAAFDKAVGRQGRRLERVLLRTLMAHSRIALVVSSMRLLAFAMPFDRCVNYAQRHLLLCDLKEVQRVRASPEGAEARVTLLMRDGETVHLTATDTAEAALVAGQIARILQLLWPRVLQAQYGERGQFLDVTEQLRELVDKRDRRTLWQGRYNDVFGQDPVPRVVKVLLVRFMVGDEEVQMAFHENAPVLLGLRWLLSGEAH